MVSGKNGSANKMKNGNRAFEFKEWLKTTQWLNAILDYMKKVKSNIWPVFITQQLI